MKHLTDEMSSRWAALACLMDEASQDSHSLRTRLCMLQRAAAAVDAIICRYGLALKAEHARKARAKAVKQLRHVEKQWSDCLRELSKKDISVKPWQGLSDAQRECAAAAWRTEPVLLKDIDMTPEALGALPSGTVFRVKGDGLTQPWIMQAAPQGRELLRAARAGKEQLFVPAVSVMQEGEGWSIYRVLRYDEEPTQGKRQGEQPHACLLIGEPGAQEETTANVRRMLGLPAEQVVQAACTCDPRGLIGSLLAQEALPERLREADFKSRVPSLLKKKHDLFSMLSDDRWLLLHPYDSAKPILTLLQEAADDEQVQEIRLCAAALQPQGRMEEALCHAAGKGRKVTVVLGMPHPDAAVERQAAAQLLTDAGCTVRDAVMNGEQQVHMLCIRRQSEDTACYAAVSTADYDDLKDKRQIDMTSLFGSDKEGGLGRDLAQVFDTLTGENDMPDCEYLHMTPFGARQEWKRLIRREMSAALRRQPCGIRLVTPALTDPELIDVLYDASQAGVPIEITVSGPCRLQPGLKGVSERISVHAYHGPLALHGTLLGCSNSGKKEHWLSSADWTPEGLGQRAGLMWQAEPAENDERLTELLDALWSDREATWELHVDEYSSLRCCGGDQNASCHSRLSSNDE